ncbi:MULTISPECIES: hypothetical protein [unclassified Chryseobacterium]|uniref:hypothetical protein n=1 Tax=unclassified Chryseobacterium TaxID=2593645 RepID=UPI000D33619A|nr:MULTISPECIES: hypothetical protein [unclassified Chryseobacterium]PTT78033.1 hypothetical protein DBR25_01430 [Chryseobacterium sp. HMWF001]PVV58282.1 hypothetical protein DD829_07195 [Chryseobacterium sp. HMWF035]
MEKNKLATREQLKKYFEKNKYPTQSQFAELIDAFKHREDLLTNKEAVILVNSLESNGLVNYSLRDIDGKISITVSSSTEEDQIIELKNRDEYTGVQYFFGYSPYTIKAKEFILEELKEYEYYLLQYQIDSNYYYNYRLFGNNLPAIEKGFQFGTLKGRMFNFQLYKSNVGQKVTIVNTRINFKNNTDVIILYRAQSENWGCRLVDEDITTDHYSLWDYLYFYYNADLSKIDQNIECSIYNDDTGQLLMTGYLYAGQNNVNTWGGGSANMVRNIRIECSYQNNQNNQNNQNVS